MRSHSRVGDMSHRHTFDDQETRPAGESEEESEGGAEWVDESRHDSNIRFHGKCTCQIVQDSSSVDTDQMVAVEEDDMNQSLVSEEHPEARVASLRTSTFCRGCRLLLLRRKRIREEVAMSNY
jgi:hypothetical protein